MGAFTALTSLYRYSPDARTSRLLEVDEHVMVVTKHPSEVLPIFPGGLVFNAIVRHGLFLIDPRLCDARLAINHASLVGVVVGPFGVVAICAAFG